LDIAAWLRGLGLAQYEPAFLENAIDSTVLRKLTAEDLKDLGVVLVGHRRRLLDAIEALGAAAPAAPETPVRSDAERRQLTVMFCDLVGSTPLSARLDPEDLRGIIGAYHRCVTEIVEGFGGFVARYMGDGVLVYFGYPQAHEDDAERATRCGLALVDRVPQLKQAEELHARVGIATGLVVVVGEVVERDVAGDTPNLAARLQALAEPDTVVIAVSTRRLTGELFEYRDLGKIELKGIAGPVSAWQALRPSAVASRFEALRGSALTPLVGRDEEIELLLRRWARVKAGDNQVVLISGEPGIGKSRIVASLVERLRDEPHLRLRYFCSPYHQNSALYPFIDQLGRAAGLDDQWGKFGPGCERQLTLPPSEYFKRQCYLALDADEEPAVDVVEKLGADYFVVSTDYPHPDGAFPEAMKEFLALSLDNAARRKILWDNCARLYDIPKLAAPLTRAAPAAAAAA
jgi:class 3 adenylate cyclase